MTRESKLRVRSTLAAMHGEPRIATPWTSQLVHGAVVDVLETSGDWRRVRSEDDYEGWMHTGYLESTRGDEAQWPVSLGCVVLDNSGGFRSLPLLARVAPESAVISGEAVSPDELLERFPLTADEIVANARRWFRNSPYQWGGTTPLGCDCSGFVQSVFRLHGLLLPRDASQQAETDFDANITWGDVAPGNLAFFSDREDRRITHVGIVLDDATMAHSALANGGFCIDEIGPGRLKQQFAGGRALVGSH